MRVHSTGFWATLPLALALGGCGFLPSQGPSASAIHKATKPSQNGHKHPNVQLVHVTPAIAKKQKQHVIQSQKQAVQSTVSKLNSSQAGPAVHLAKGDKVSVKIWTLSPWPAATGSSSGSSSGGVSTAPKAVKLGHYTVNSKGRINLPYVGSIHVAGLTPKQAENRISARYKTRGVLQSPNANLTLTQNRAQTITVTGATRKPQSLAWRPGGISLSQAIAKGRGPRATKTQSGQQNRNAQSANRNVAVIVRNGTHYVIPLNRASVSTIHLRPGDKVMLQSRPLARVQFLGPGAKHDQVVSFNKTPTLSRGIAKDGGLSSTAQGRSIYVLRSRHTSQPTVYKFAWDQLSGVRAAHQFPLRNGDVVYIANSPSVKFQQLTNLLFKTVFPISTVKTIGGL